MLNGRLKRRYVKYKDFLGNFMRNNFEELKRIYFEEHKRLIYEMFKHEMLDTRRRILLELFTVVDKDNEGKYYSMIVESGQLLDSSLSYFIEDVDSERLCKSEKCSIEWIDFIEGDEIILDLSDYSIYAVISVKRLKKRISRLTSGVLDIVVEYIGESEDVFKRTVKDRHPAIESIKEGEIYERLYIAYGKLFDERRKEIRSDKDYRIAVEKALIWQYKPKWNETGLKDYKGSDMLIYTGLDRDDVYSYMETHCIFCVGSDGDRYYLSEIDCDFCGAKDVLSGRCLSCGGELPSFNELWGRM